MFMYTTYVPGDHGGYTRVLDTLELEFQAILRHLMCVHGIEPMSSARAASVLDLRGISPGLSLHSNTKLKVQDSMPCVQVSSVV